MMSFLPSAVDASKSQERGDAVHGRDDPPGPGSPAPGPGDGPLKQLPLPPSRSRNAPQRVDHTYRDYSRLHANELQPRKKQTNFPSKLHKILSTDEFTHIISWMPHGRCWKIHDKVGLMREVVPKYFSQGKYESFTRQLNGWSFKRLHQSGNDSDAYYHDCFLRRLPHLTALIRRMPRNQGKLIPHAEGEPNFYELALRFPLPPHPPVAPPQVGSHQGQYLCLPRHAMEAGAGHGAPPEPPTVRHTPEHYTPRPRNYPPFMAQHCAGRPGDPRVAAAYALPQGYSPHPFYAPPPAHNPHCPCGPPHGTLSHFVSSALNRGPEGAANYQQHPALHPSLPGKLSLTSSVLHQAMDPVLEALRTMKGAIQEERAPEDEKGREECLDPWSSFMRAETPHHQI